MKNICVRCKRIFDFELYSGLCPHCGCFHRRPGISLNGQKYEPMGKTVVRPDIDTLEHSYEKHLRQDQKKGIDHSNHKTVVSQSEHKKANLGALIFILIIWAIIIGFCTYPEETAEVLYKIFEAIMKLFE